MKKILLMMMLSLTLMACERQDNVNNLPKGQDYDNTGKNVRDRDSATITPLDQSESTADRAITQRIRQAIIADDSFSSNAKNIKIMTINGVVTLRGPVASPEEKDAIAKIVSNIQGVKKLDNQLEFTRPNY